MRISAVDYVIEDFELARPYSIAFRSVDQVSNAVVRRIPDQGALGLGAGSPEPFVTGETMDACAAAYADYFGTFLGTLGWWYLRGPGARRRKLLKRASTIERDPVHGKPLYLPSLHK